MAGKLEGKVAVVTAAGSGIGKACAERFAAEGARVVVSDVNPETGAATAKGIEQSGGLAIASPCDVSDSLQVNALVQTAVSEFGRLDLMMNVAGLPLPGAMADVTDVTDEAWRKVYAVTVEGTLYGIRAALAVMVPQGSGVILNVASGAAFMVQPPLCLHL